jgi:histone H3/H4
MRTVENNHGISTKGAETVAAMTMEIFEKIANTAHQLAYSSGKKTLTDVELEAAARICLPPGMFKATNSWANQKVNAATK